MKKTNYLLCVLLVFTLLFTLSVLSCGDGGDDDSETTAPVVSISNLHNNSIVKTGFVTGTASAGVTSVEVSLDGGTFNSASGTDNWTYVLPSGSSTWAYCSEHTISVRSSDAAGNISDITTITLIKGINSDFNGDGYSDVIIGANAYDNGSTNEGMAFVYYGSSKGLSTTADWTAESNQIDAYFGCSVSTAGDVNGDGYADVIIGSHLYDNGETDEGMAFVYYGSSSGLSTIADWTVEGNQADALFGKWVSTAGDVNGDGYSDVIVGSHLYDNGETDEGMAFVYHGSSSGLSTIADWTAESDQVDAYFGCSVSTAGDINGDGYSDVIVGADYYDNGESAEGRAFVYNGSSSGLSTSADWTAESNLAGARFGYSVCTAGDVNGDGYSDVIVGAPYFNPHEGTAFVYFGSSFGLSLSDNWTVEGDQADMYFSYSVSTSGDVNGDGYSDIIIGSHLYDNGETDEGMAFVYHGSSSGLSTSADWTAESNQDEASFGHSLSLAGDVNGDGYSDVIVGAYRYDNGESNEGMAFIYSGSSEGLSSTADWTAEGDQIDAYFGASVSD
jgi:hypothetical protein